MEKKPSNKNNKPPQFQFNAYWIYAVILIGLLAFSLFGNRQTYKKVTMTELERYIKNDQVESMIVQKRKDVVEAFIKDSSVVAVFGKEIKNKQDAKIIVTIPSSERFPDFMKDMYNKYGKEKNTRKRKNKLSRSYF